MEYSPEDLSADDNSVTLGPDSNLTVIGNNLHVGINIERYPGAVV
jgi:hypothetical protein